MTLLTHGSVPAQRQIGFEQYYCPGSPAAAAVVTRVGYSTAGRGYIEARYNYDAEECIGVSAGKQFSQVNANGWAWTLTPTAGIVAGNRQAFSLGAQFGLDFRGWNLSSALQTTPLKGEGYTYSWSELGYSFGDRVYFGAALQQDCRSGSACQWSPGLTGQLSLGSWNFPLYVFNPLDKRVWLLMGVTREWVLHKRIDQHKKPSLNP